MNDIFGQTLRKLRKERGLTQEQLAQRLHVTRQTVSYWENGRTQPDYDTLAHIADEFEVPIATLLQEQADAEQTLPMEPEEAAIEPAAPDPVEMPSGGKSVRLRKGTVFIALMLFMALVVGAAFMTRQGEEAFSIERFTQAQSAQEGQAFLTITTRESPVQAIRGKPGIDAYWRYTVMIRETNGVGIMLDRVTYVTFYRGGKTTAVSYVTDILRENVGTTVIGPNEIRLIQAMEIADRNALGMGILIEGTDEHGNSLSFHQYIPYAYTLD